MERKIGEIFEYNGEWYQCVKSPYGSCKHCDMNFAGKCPIPIKECVASSRSDLSYVIFKKIEKVGEPRIKALLSNPTQHLLVQKYRVEVTPSIMPNEPPIHFNALDNTIEIEIKSPIKEDMEEKKTSLPKEDNHLTRTVYAYVDGKISDKELIRCIKEMSDEYPYDKNNLKPFSLELAKAGKPVCTRDGRKARIICFDKKKDIYPLIALVTDKDGYEIITLYKADGVHPTIPNNDLMMLTEKKEGWVNVYYDNDAPYHREASWVYDKEEEAIKVGKEHGGCYIATVRIEWEE